MPAASSPTTLLGLANHALPYLRASFAPNHRRQHRGSTADGRFLPQNLCMDRSSVSRLLLDGCETAPCLTSPCFAFATSYSSGHPFIASASAMRPNIIALRCSPQSIVCQQAREPDPDLATLLPLLLPLPLLPSLPLCCYCSVAAAC